MMHTHLFRSGCEGLFSSGGTHPASVNEEHSDPSMLSTPGKHRPVEPRPHFYKKKKNLKPPPKKRMKAFERKILTSARPRDKSTDDSPASFRPILFTAYYTNFLSNEEKSFHFIFPEEEKKIIIPVSGTDYDAESCYPTDVNTKMTNLRSL